MWRQRVRLAFLIVAGGAFAAELYVFAPAWGPAPVYRRAYYDRIQPGMTYYEVESLLGKDRGGIPDGHTMAGSDIGPRPGCRGSTWFGGDMVVQVCQESARDVY